MDTRLLGKKKDTQPQETGSAIEKLNEDQLILRPDKINTDKAYTESIIYNLVRRFDHLDFLERKYNEELEKVETTPKWIKYYVHNSGKLSFL
jgi:hypothetical protein